MNLSFISLFAVAAIQQLASASAFSFVMATSTRTFSTTDTSNALHSTVESLDSAQQTVASPNAITSLMDELEPIDHEFELAVNRISSLVYRWMSIFDENRGDAAPLLDLMSPEGFSMHLTSTPVPITTIAALKTWFADVGTKVKTVNHLVQSIDVTKLEDGAFGVKILLTCPVVSASDVSFTLYSVHNWEVVDYGGQYPKIRRFATKVVNPDGSAMSLDQGSP